MKNILKLIFTAIVILIVISVAGFLLVLLSYGIGWLLRLLLPLSAFEATLLSLVALAAVAIAALRLFSAIVSTPPLPGSYLEDDENLEDDEFDEFEDLLDFEDEEAEPEFDFSNVKPDDRCPCGSGRKYKNCHGKGIVR